MLKAIMIMVAVVATSALVAIAGELHRSNCLRAGRTACSALVWNDGKPKPPSNGAGRLPLP